MIDAVIIHRDLVMYTMPRPYIAFKADACHMEYYPYRKFRIFIPACVLTRVSRPKTLLLV